MSILEAAKARLDAGYSVFPIRAGTKQPAVPAWKPFQREFISEPEAKKAFAGLVGIGRVCGAISGNHEVIDFDVDDDCPYTLNELFTAFQEKIDPELLSRLTIVQTPRPGYHVSYRCQMPVSGAQKLAGYEQEDGKVKFFVETRGEGGYVLDIACPAGVHPSGRTYKHLAGPTLEDSKPISIKERNFLLDLARSFCELPEKPEPREYVEHREFRTDNSTTGLRPGDDFEQQITWPEILEPHGYEFIGSKKKLIRRPGTTNRWSGAINNNGNLVMWSPNTPFEQHPGTGEGPTTGKFAAFAILNHGGDFEAAARQLGENGFGDSSIEDRSEMASAIDHIMSVPTEDEIGEYNPQLPPAPEDYPDVPLTGLIEDIVEHTLATTRYPQKQFAIGGAMALLSIITGRKVADETNTRTNIFAMAIGESGCGKDHPRKINADILEGANAHKLIGPEGFKSESAFVSALAETPAQLFQLDEAGYMFAQTKGKRAAAHMASLPGTLNRIYSSANRMWKSDAYADASRNGSLASPHAVVFATSTPGKLWSGLDEHAATEGLLGRFLIFEEDKHAPCQKPIQHSLSHSAEKAVQQWADFLETLLPSAPEPLLAPYATNARIRFDEYCQTIHEEAQQLSIDGYTSDNLLVAALKRREREKTAKVALLLAISRAYTPERLKQVELADVENAITFMSWQTSRLISNVTDNISSTEYEGDMNRVMSVIPFTITGISRSKLLRAIRTIRAADLDKLLSHLVESGRVESYRRETKGRTGVHYRRYS